MTARLLVVLVLFSCACDPGDPLDAGVMDAGGGPDAAIDQCARDLDCLQSFCEPTRCRPGSGGDGCEAAPSPCAVGEMCDPVAELCAPGACADDPDADGDGHDSLACGGDDCDDDDVNRFGGNGEVCDAEGHDEDCVADTVGDTDADEDGFVDAMCCNGAECGPDCDDSLADVRPGVAETCNGRDDNCDGAADEIDAGPLCPGGVCTGGSCRLDAWDHTFGGDGAGGTSVFALRVAMDRAANVYVAGIFSGAEAFDSGTLTSRPVGENNEFVIAYDGDGTHRWDRQIAGRLDSDTLAMAASPDESLLYLASSFRDSLEVGSGMDISAAGDHLFVAALSAADGATRSVRAIPIAGEGHFWGVQTTSDVIRLLGEVQVPSSIDGTRVSGAFILELDATLATRSVRDLEGSTAATALAPLPGGGYSLIGFAPRRFDSGCATSPAGGFVAGFDDDGGCRWAVQFADRVTPRDVATTPTGATRVVGSFSGSVDFGGGSRDPVSGAENGFIVEIDAAGGYAWDRAFHGPFAVLTSLANTSSGVLSAGEFVDRITVGGSTVAGNSYRDTILIELSDSGAFRRTRTFASDQPNSASDIAVGMGDSVVLVGTFFGRLTLGTGTFVGPAAYITRLPSG